MMKDNRALIPVVKMALIIIFILHFMMVSEKRSKIVRVSMILEILIKKSGIVSKKCFHMKLFLDLNNVGYANDYSKTWLLSAAYGIIEIRRKKYFTTSFDYKLLVHVKGLKML